METGDEHVTATIEDDNDDDFEDVGPENMFMLVRYAHTYRDKCAYIHITQSPSPKECFERNLVPLPSRRLYVLMLPLYAVCVRVCTPTTFLWV